MLESELEFELELELVSSSRVERGLGLNSSAVNR